MNTLPLLLLMTLFATPDAKSTPSQPQPQGQKNVLSLSTPNQKKSLPLFRTYPKLRDSLPHLSLSDGPTPISQLKNISHEQAVKNLYLKDDGKTSTHFGGNKVRKLEFLLADALDKDAQVVLTVGGAGSNHATATAVHAKRAGLASISCLSPQLSTNYLRRNLLVMQRAQTIFKPYTSKASRTAGLVDIGRKFKSHKKKPPYFIPEGGSDKIGTIGFVNAAFEIKDQMRQRKLEEPDLIFTAVGSGGTVAGLVLGLKLAKLKTRVVAVQAANPAFGCTWKNMIVKLAQQTLELLREHDPSIEKVQITEDDFDLEAQTFEGTYAQVTPSIAHAMKTLYDLEQFKVDGTYAGVALAALLTQLKAGKLKNKNVLLWKTFFSEPLETVTQNEDYKTLPEVFHHYFQRPVQELDQQL